MQNLFKDMPQYKKDLKVCQVCNSFQKYEKNHKQVFKRTLEHEEEKNTKVLSSHVMCHATKLYSVQTQQSMKKKVLNRMKKTRCRLCHSIISSLIQ